MKLHKHLAIWSITFLVLLSLVFIGIPFTTGFHILNSFPLTDWGTSKPLENVRIISAHS